MEPKGEAMDWRKEYRDQGFVIVENVLSHQLIDAHLSDVAALLNLHGVTDAATQASLPWERDDKLMVAMLALHRKSDVARNLIFNRVVVALLTQLFGGKPMLTMARSGLWEQGNMRAHVDTAFRSPEPPYSICRIWCALEDIHPDSGRFFLVPGTHRTLTPRLCWEVLNERENLQALFKRLPYDSGSWLRLHGLGWPYVSAKVADRIDEGTKLSFSLNKGDIVIFNPAVAHGTLPCTDASLTRKMMVCEWALKEDSTLITPRLAHIENTFRKRKEDNLIDITPMLAERAASR